MSVPSLKTRFLVNLRLLVKEHRANIGIPLDTFGFCYFSDFFPLKFLRVLISLQTSLLCIVGKLAGGGSVTVKGDR